VALGLLFDFTNGFHDSANAIAVPVTTKAITPKVAVLFAAGLNIAGAFSSLAVAKTIGSGIVDPKGIALDSILAGLFGGIVWNVASWRLGLPSSSSQALIGGLIGAGLAHAGSDVINWHALAHKVVEPAILSPLIGFTLTAILVLIFGFRIGRWLDSKPRLVRPMTLVTGGFVAYAHGANDAQKTMGVITLALLTAGYIDTFDVPTWVILVCATAMALGTYAGGWRIVATLGHRITELNMRRGMLSQLATAAVLFTTANKGFPVSTTHVVTGSILGTDAERRWRNTNWSVAGSIVAAWCLTIPCSAAVGAIFDSVHRLPGGEAVTMALIAAGILWFWRNRTALFATNDVATADAEQAAEAAGIPVAAPA
jgi:inorganic phosphate transporter, PiT family